jgi:hypothetical protein
MPVTPASHVGRPTSRPKLIAQRGDHRQIHRLARVFGAAVAARAREMASGADSARRVLVGRLGQLDDDRDQLVAVWQEEPAGPERAAVDAAWSAQAGASAPISHLIAPVDAAGMNAQLKRTRAPADNRSPRSEL